jgi:hypothetical protein
MASTVEEGEVLSLLLNSIGLGLFVPVLRPFASLFYVTWPQSLCRNHRAVRTMDHLQGNTFHVRLLDDYR